MKYFYSNFKNKIYEFFYGHPFLLNEEVKIICETRSDLKLKHFNDCQIQELIKYRIKKMYKEYKINKTWQNLK